MGGLHSCSSPELFTMTQKQFYKTKEWRAARRAYIDERIATDGGVCEKCHMELGKIVHHYKIWLNDDNCNDPNISLNPENFMYECQTCHNKEQQSVNSRYKFDSNGNILPP